MLKPIWWHSKKGNQQLANDVAEVIKAGKEEDRFYRLSSKIRE
jgi:hypothetical protein